MNLLKCTSLYAFDKFNNPIENVNGYVLCKSVGNDFITFFQKIPKTSIKTFANEVKFLRIKENRKEIFNEIKETLFFKVYLELIKNTLGKNENIQRKVFHESVINEPLSEHFYLNKLVECCHTGCRFNRWLCGKRKVYRRSIEFQYIRDFFENFIARDVKNKFEIDQQIIYTSFGSGGLLQSFLQILKLKYLGFTKFILHFVDKIYKNPENIEKIKDIKSLKKRDSTSLHRFYAFYEYFFENEKTDSIRIFIWDKIDDYVKCCKVNPQTHKCHILSILDGPLGELRERKYALKVCLQQKGCVYFTHQINTDLESVSNKKKPSFEIRATNFSNINTSNRLILDSNDVLSLKETDFNHDLDTFFDVSSKPHPKDF